MIVLICRVALPCILHSTVTLRCMLYCIVQIMYSCCFHDCIHLLSTVQWVYFVGENVLSKSKFVYHLFIFHFASHIKQPRPLVKHISFAAPGIMTTEKKLPQRNIPATRQLIYDTLVWLQVRLTLQTWFLSLQTNIAFIVLILVITQETLNPVDVYEDGGLLPLGGLELNCKSIISLIT